MRTVVYAVNGPASPAHREHLRDQLAQSLASLRAHNAEVPVRVYAFGDTGDLPGLADRHRVELLERGSYEDALDGHCSRSRAAVLAHYPVLHKWLALATIAQADGDQVLYVDNDTFFFDDVARIFDAHATSDFYAREEPFSTRSAAGYRPEYIDEPRLFALAEAEGRRPLPTYNLGAVVLNHRLCARLDVADLLDNVWRLCLGIVREVEPRAYQGETQLEVMARRLSDYALEPSLSYPSSNYWIVEQLALLFTLGRIEDLSHEVLAKEHVVQGVEYHFLSPGERPAMSHYYSSNTKAFFEWVRSR